MTQHSLERWLKHLETLHPKSIDLGLERIQRVAEALSLAPKRTRTLTIAGTNGKGSCIAAVEALLRASGDTVGVYTSPHLIRFNERFRINGEEPDDNAILRAFHAIDAARGDTTLSYFEFATLAALWLFQAARVDWQLLEVGLGGRLDAVNMLDADACVITSIGIDHVEWLGETRDLIAPEKAGVARAGCPAVVAERDLPSTLLPALENLGADVLLIDRDWQLSEGQLTLPSGASFDLPEVRGLQSANMAAAAVLVDAVGCTITSSIMERAFSGLAVPGRQQRCDLQGRDCWLDVSHNREAVAALAAALAGESKPQRTHAVFGAMADKPLRDMIDIMAGWVDFWHFPAAQDIPRAAMPADLATLVAPDKSACYDGAAAAAEGVLAATAPGDRIIVFGSFITVGAQLQHMTVNERLGSP